MSGDRTQPYPGKDTGTDPSPTIADVAAVARAALAAGISVVPPAMDGTKRPLSVWKRFQAERAESDQIDRWYGPCTGVGLVTGLVSAGLELFEFDDRATYMAFRDRARGVGLDDLVERIESGYLEETPGEGVHWLYRCDEIRGNTKLAERPGPPGANGRVAREVLIETRGDHGYVVVAPSFGSVHSSGRPYRLVRGGISSVVTLIPEERDALWELARTFDGMPRPAAPIHHVPPQGDGHRPGEDYAARVTWSDILVPHGWTLVYTSEEEGYWRRPGKSLGVSATTNVGGSDLLYVFSTSTEFEPQRSYSKFGAYAQLAHRGDLQAAARALAGEGYGEPRHAHGAARNGSPNGKPSIITDETEDESDWPPLRLGMLPTVEPFPVDVFPEPVARFALDAAGAVGVDVGLVGCSILAIAGGLIGRSASLLLGANWFASSSLFVANVALPGDGKSPALRYAATPVREIDLELAEEFTEEKLAYLERSRLAEKKEKPGPSPVPRRVVAEDATMEAVCRVLAANPRGLVMVFDELSVLLGGLGQYKNGRGNDRSNFLKIWSGSPILVDRVLNEFGEPVRIPFPSLSVVGNLPPACLTDLIAGRGDDGLLDRWLFCFPDRLPKLKGSQRRPVSNESLQGWVEVARRLWSRQMDVQGERPCPHTIYPSNQGKSEFDRFDDDLVDEMNSADFPDSLRGPLSKLQEYSGRLWLVLTLLKHASDPTADPHLLPLAGPDTARGAWNLIKYFHTHHRRVRAYLEGHGPRGMPEGARLALNWVRNHPGRDSFSERDLALSYPPSRGYHRAMMADGLLWLANRNALRPAPAKDRPEGTVGRRPSPIWKIHPELQEAQRKQQVQRNERDFVEVVDSVVLPGGEIISPERAGEEVGEWTS